MRREKCAMVTARQPLQQPCERRKHKRRQRLAKKRQQRSRRKMMSRRRLRCEVTCAYCFETGPGRSRSYILLHALSWQAWQDCRLDLMEKFNTAAPASPKHVPTSAEVPPKRVRSKSSPSRISAKSSLDGVAKNSEPNPNAQEPTTAKEEMPSPSSQATLQTEPTPTPSQRNGSEWAVNGDDDWHNQGGWGYWYSRVGPTMTITVGPTMTITVGPTMTITVGPTMTINTATSSSPGTHVTGATGMAGLGIATTTTTTHPGRTSTGENLRGMLP